MRTTACISIFVKVVMVSAYYFFKKDIRKIAVENRGLSLRKKPI